MRVRVEQVGVDRSVATCVGREVESGARIVFHIEFASAELIAEAVRRASKRHELPVTTVHRSQVYGATHR